MLAGPNGSRGRAVRAAGRPRARHQRRRLADRIHSHEELDPVDLAPAQSTISISPPPATTAAAVVEPTPAAADDSAATPSSTSTAGKTASPRRTTEGDADAPAPDDLPPILTADELTGLLRLERKAVYAALERGEIPGARRIGRAWRISRDAVLQWLAEGRGGVTPKGRKTR